MLTLALTGAAAAAATAAGLKLAGAKRKADALSAAQRRAEGRVSREVERFDHLKAEAIAAAEREAAQLEDDLQDTESTLEAHESRLARRRENVERRAAEVEARHAELSESFDSHKARRAELKAQSEQVTALDEESLQVLERIVGQDREAISADLQDEASRLARIAAGKKARQLEARAEEMAERDAKALMDTICQRYGNALPADRLNSRVLFPSKASTLEALLDSDREILTALSQAADVDISEQNEAHFFVEGPDPFTREIGRLALSRLVKSKTLSAAEAQAQVEKAKTDLDRIVRDAGRRAAKVLRLKQMDEGILYLVGKLLYRTSYTQNQWQHAIESAHLCGMMAPSLGVNTQLARRAGLIHDIGKVLWAETEAVGSHAVSGAAFARAHGENDDVIHAIAAHHNDEKPSTALAHLVAAGDALSGARPGARRETLEAYSDRIETLEAICARYPAIKGSMVIQGGRELRTSVDPRELDDMAAARLSADLAQAIEEEMVYPGQIKVVVIREQRSTATARR